MVNNCRRNVREYTFNPSWKGSNSSYTGKLYVLRWSTNASGLPSQYDGFSSKDLTISDGGNFSGKDFIPADLTDPAEQNISGSISLPTSSYQLKNKSFYLHFGDAYVYLGGESGTSLTLDFSYTVPTISGTTFEIDAQAELASTPTNRLCSFWKMGIAAGASNINVSLADAPKLNFPAHNGTNIDTTTQFLWAFGGATGVYYVVLSPTSGLGTNPTHYIFTSNNSLYIPNLNPQGLGFTSKIVEYQWQTYLYYPSSINECATENFIPFINGNAGDRGFGSSEVFKFRTKP